MPTKPTEPPKNVPTNYTPNEPPDKAVIQRMKGHGRTYRIESERTCLYIDKNRSLEKHPHKLITEVPLHE